MLPILALWRLTSHRAMLWGVRAGNIARLNLYFFSAASFDLVRSLGYTWASLGIQISSGFIFALIGFMGASLYYCPEAISLPEAWKRLKSHHSILFYEGIVITWVLLNVLLPAWYLPYTIIVLTAATIYPTRLFWAARKRARPPHVRNAIATLSIIWFVFVTFGTFLFVLGNQPPILPFSIDYGWGIAFLAGSIMFFTMSFVEANPLGGVRFPTGQLIPETMIKLGHQYLILHDSGRRAISFLSSTLKGLIDSGAKVIVSAPSSGWLVGGLSQNEHYGEWKKNGRIVVSEPGTEQNSPREGLTERLSLGPISTVYLNELGQDALQGKIEPIGPSSLGEKYRERADLFLLESSEAPRSQLTDFLRQNTGMELLSLTESADSFSSLVDLDHQKLRGSTILLEYDSSCAYEETVDKFFAEGISNAEICLLFTTKSSKLYRAIKGKRMIKIIAASSLISAPDELPDGEMQIPDKELGLVAAIVSDYLDNSKSSGASFVFDSLTDLIRGERWEQVYSGTRQLIELLTVPNATTLFLANVNTMEPRFLAALRGAFATQLRMDNYGLTAVKIPSN